MRATDFLKRMACALPLHLALLSGCHHGRIEHEKPSTATAVTTAFSTPVGTATMAPCCASASSPAVATPPSAAVADQMTLTGEPSLTIAVGAAYSFRSVATNGTADPITFSIRNLPVWASFDSATGELSGSPGDGDVGTFTAISLSASDGTASANLASFSITVLQAPNTVTLTWGAPGTAANGNSAALGGFRIYYGTDATGMTNVIDLDDPSATTYTINGLVPGNWHFGITAYDADRVESSLSELVVQNI